jgi:hypothetical protein
VCRYTSHSAVSGVIGGLQTIDSAPTFAPCSCWVLGRYSKWLVERAEGGQRGELDRCVAGVCERVLDHNRRVQVCLVAAAVLLIYCLGPVDTEACSPGKMLG